MELTKIISKCQESADALSDYDLQLYNEMIGIIAELESQKEQED